MSDKESPRYLVRRQAKVQTDGRGRTIWADPVETAELELVSTVALKKILDTDDGSKRESMQKVAADSSDGVLAQDPSNGQFSIIDDDDLQAILDQNKDLPPVTRPVDVTLVPLRKTDEAAAEELSLVSTQALRKVLGHKEPEPEETFKLDPGGGFDPYNTG